MKVKIVNKSRFALPEYQTPLSAGLDIRANLDEPVTLQPLERAMIPTGLFVELPEGCEMQIRPRSGLAAKHGMELTVTVEGADEEKAAAELQAFFAANL